jgi:hypothetical protein
VACLKGQKLASYVLGRYASWQFPPVAIFVEQAGLMEFQHDGSK